MRANTQHQGRAEHSNRQPYERWKEAGSTTFGDRANRKIREILKNHKVVKLDQELESQIMAVVKNRDVVREA